MIGETSPTRSSLVEMKDSEPMIQHRHDDTDECECAICAGGAEEFEAWERDMFREHGWFAHYVHNACDAPYHTNIHTHGISQSFGHPDLQICFPLSMEQGQGILHGAVDQIQSGVRIVPRVAHGGLLQDYNVGVVAAIECGREVMRIVIPGSDGNTGERSIDPDFADQWTLLETT
jgi:hypothetical protein